MLFDFLNSFWRAFMKEKKGIERIKSAGKLRRTCHKHRYLLMPTQMAVLDHNNCDFCRQHPLTIIKSLYDL